MNSFISAKTKCYNRRETFQLF